MARTTRLSQFPWMVGLEQAIAVLQTRFKKVRDGYAEELLRAPEVEAAMKRRLPSLDDIRSARSIAALVVPRRGAYQPDWSRSLARRGLSSITGAKSADIAWRSELVAPFAEVEARDERRRARSAIRDHDDVRPSIEILLIHLLAARWHFRQLRRRFGTRWTRKDQQVENGFRRIAKAITLLLVRPLPKEGSVASHHLDRALLDALEAWFPKPTTQRERYRIVARIRLGTDSATPEIEKLAKRIEEKIRRAKRRRSGGKPSAKK